MGVDESLDSSYLWVLLLQLTIASHLTVFILKLLQKNLGKFLNQSITSQLDSIAEECGKRIREEEEQRNPTSSTMSGVEKLLLVKDILVNEYKFTGNSENYYDYRNSLLNHVLETRKGIPITLCIVFACICRRLGLHTFIVGLPGHIVLGFQDNTHMDDSGFYVPGETIYLDVFNSGKVLSALDCKRKVFMYQVLWNDKYLYLKNNGSTDVKISVFFMR